jgi:hypothetical protein
LLGTMTVSDQTSAKGTLRLVAAEFAGRIAAAARSSQ